MKITFTDDQKKAIFKELASKRLYDVALEFGLDKVFKKKSTMVQTIYKVRREVENEPARFGVTTELVELVNKAIGERSATPAARPDFLALEEAKLTDLFQGITKKAAFHLDQKLSKKTLSGVSITQLAQVMGISFDKFQLASGKATENIAFKAKIDNTMTPEQLMAELLKHRENAQTKEN